MSRRKFERLDALVDSFVYRECLTILAAGPYTGKSRFSISFCLQLTRGEETIFGQFPPMRVLYCSERSWKENCESFVESGLEEKDVLNENFRFFCLPDVPEHDQEKIYTNSFEYISSKHMTREWKPEIVIFDTAMRFQHPESKKSRDPSNNYALNLKMLDSIKRWATIHQVGVILIYHSPKQNEKTKYDDPFQRILGSTAILGSSTAVAIMESVDAEQHIIDMHFKSHIKPIKSPRRFQMVDFTFNEIEQEEATLELTEFQAKVLALIPEDHLVPLGKLITDIHEKVGTDKSRNNIANTIRKLKNKRLLEVLETEPGTYSVRRLFKLTH